MTAPTQGCLFSTIKNTSGGEKHFGFLPPHGKTLDANEEITVFGDIANLVRRNAGHHNLRAQNALAQAIADGDLTVVSTPCVIVYDEADLASYRIGSNNATFEVYEPNWESDDYASI
jgi:hypothetical protein